MPEPSKNPQHLPKDKMGTRLFIIVGIAAIAATIVIYLYSTWPE